MSKPSNSTPKPRAPRYVKTVEAWYPGGDTNRAGRAKMTTRVVKGDPSGRGGQFHGSTNFKER